MIAGGAGPAAGVHERYAVFGQPVGHSRSPQIHALFAAQFGTTIDYQRIEAAPGSLAAALARFAAEGGVGCNITVPLKEEAAALAHARSAAVAACGAANTLELRGGRIVAHNTDGLGLIRDMRDNLGIALAGAHVLLLGAGGAAAGVCGPLLDAGIARLVVANRGLERARALAARCQDQLGPSSPCKIEARSLEQIAVARSATRGPEPTADEPFTLVIQATSAGLGQQLVAPARERLADRAWCYDMLYAAQQSTPFTRWARQHGLRCADGLGMLVEQAAAAYAIWRGRKPDTAPVLSQLRQSIDGDAGATA